MFGSSNKDGTKNVPATGGGTFAFGSAPAPSSGASFAFGSSGGSNDKNAGVGGGQNTLSFGAANSSGAPAPATSGSSTFSFGGNTATAPAPSTSGTSFGFGGSSQAASKVTAAAFSFGGNGGSQQAPTGDKSNESAELARATTFEGKGLSFGATSTSGTSAASTAQEKRAAPAATSGFSAPDVKQPSPKVGGFSFGASQTTNQNIPTSTNGNSNPFAKSSAAPTQSTDSKIPVAATAGFSFGGATSKTGDGSKTSTTAGGGASLSFTAAPATTPNAPKTVPGQESKVPAATNFFGGAGPKHPAAESKESAAPSGGAGFSFNPATTPNAPKTGFSAATPGTPKPVESPKAGTATTVNLANSSAAVVAVVPTAAVANIPKMEYQTLTVEQILNRFQGELERDTVEYLKESRRVAQYDAILRDSQRSLSALTQKTSTLLLQQTELEGMLTGIGTFHSEFENNLDQLEGQVDQLFGAQAHLSPSDADMQRENAYATAVQCDQRLESLSHSVCGTLEQLEIVGDDEVANILKILHQHQMQLADLEHASRVMEHDIHQLNNSLNQ